MPSSFLAKLSLLQDYGIDAVEIFCTPRHLNITDPEEVQRAGMAIRDQGFRAVSMHAPSAVGDLSSLDELQREETIMNCQKTLDAAMLMGATLVTFHPSSIEGEMTQAKERYLALQETLRDLSGYAEDRDVKIAIENFPCPFFGCEPVELYQKIKEVDAPNVGMCLDIGHAFVGDHLPKVLPELGEKIFAVHASDNRGRVDEHMSPGQGVIPWEQIINGLRQIDFKGPFVIEVRDGKKTSQILEDVINFAEQHGFMTGVGQLSH
ncbi:MAG: sugar phosphate isomerase/epimerase family protein [bacterium]|jgi:sugar phosphate isomerase/epimerase